MREIREKKPFESYCDGLKSELLDGASSALDIYLAFCESDEEHQAVMRVSGRISAEIVNIVDGDWKKIRIPQGYNQTPRDET